MRIALDGTPLTLRTGGITRYTAELSAALAGGFPEDEYLLVTDQPLAPAAGLPAAYPNLRVMPAPDNPLRRRWWSLGLASHLARTKTDVFHGTDFAVPYLPLRPSVLTLHDLSPWMDAEWQGASERVRRRTPWLLRSGIATMVITPTEAVRREAIERFRLAPGCVRAVPLAASASLRAETPAPPDRRYLLYAGALEPRKNLGLLIECWRQLRRRHAVDLVLVGRRRPDFALPPAGDGLAWRGEIADAELAQLYAGAAAVVYPSMYEGFGLPVLEAMQCGALVIASRLPAVSEVAGDAAVLLPPDEPRKWLAALEAAMSRPAWSDGLRARARARAREFSWARTARETRAVYEEARERFGP
jgi:glycosyltransferase involved in cell wall biosynthesis